MARTYRKTEASLVRDGERKVRKIDRRHGLAVVADGSQPAAMVADVFVSDGKRVRFDRRNCDDRPYEIPGVKRKIKRFTARKIRRCGRLADGFADNCE